MVLEVGVGGIAQSVGGGLENIGVMARWPADLKTDLVTTASRPCPDRVQTLSRPCP
jgi:hypothetical protein